MDPEPGDELEELKAEVEKLKKRVSEIEIIVYEGP